MVDESAWNTNRIIALLDIGQSANNECLIYSKGHRFDQKGDTEKNPEQIIC